MVSHVLVTVSLAPIISNHFRVSVHCQLVGPTAACKDLQQACQTNTYCSQQTFPDSQGANHLRLPVLTLSARLGLLQMQSDSQCRHASGQYIFLIISSMQGSTGGLQRLWPSESHSDVYIKVMTPMAVMENSCMQNQCWLSHMG